MEKIVSISYQEYSKYTETIQELRMQLQELNKSKISLEKEIAFLKDSGENILVIVKSTNKPDVHEYKSDEKTIISDLVLENQKIRERYDELSRKNDNLENQKSMILIKYQEMDNYYKNTINTLQNTIDRLENRGFVDRIVNKKTNNEVKILEAPKQLLLLKGDNSNDGEVKEIEINDIKKPRGWNMKPEFIDEEGNVYHKGVLQPDLKK